MVPKRMNLMMSENLNITITCTEFSMHSEVCLLWPFRVTSKTD